MSEFDKVANDILKGLNENFIDSAADAIQHRWALTIAHPGLGEEDEEFRVIDHNLTADGVIEEYYVEYKDELVSVPASEVKRSQMKTEMAFLIGQIKSQVKMTTHNESWRGQMDSYNNRTWHTVFLH